MFQPMLSELIGVAVAARTATRAVVKKVSAETDFMMKIGKVRRECTESCDKKMLVLQCAESSKCTS
jgi:hypothetical protein